MYTNIVATTTPTNYYQNYDYYYHYYHYYYFDYLYCWCFHDKLRLAVLPLPRASVKFYVCNRFYDYNEYDINYN